MAKKKKKQEGTVALTGQAVTSLINDAAYAYAAARGVRKEDIEMAAAELKRHYSILREEFEKATKSIAKRSAAGRPGAKRKVAKKPAKKVAKKARR